MNTEPLSPLSPSPPRGLSTLGKRVKEAPSAPLKTSPRAAPAPLDGPGLADDLAPLPAICFQIPLPEGFSFRLLNGSPQDRDALLSHWLRLSGEDRRMRFFSPTSDEVLISRASKLNFRAPRVIAVFDPQDRLVATGEWATEPEDPLEAECAFSCDKDQRGRGVSKALGRACFFDAAQFGIARARIDTLRENSAARALAQSLGARWVAAGNGFGVAHALVDAQANPKLAWRPASPKAKAHAL